MAPKVELVDVEEFGDALLQKLKKRRFPVKVPVKKKIFSGKVEESAVLMLSDIHSGQVTKFLDPDTKKLETTYDLSVMMKERERLVDGVETINYLLSHAYQIDKLYIFALGDLVENDLIFKGQRFFVEKPVGEQLIILVDMIAGMIERFLQSFQEVEFVCVIGNHGRLSEKREASPVANSFDFLAGQMLKLMFKGQPRVKITLSESWCYYADIYDWRYFLHHGDTVYSWMSLPYYGLVRQGKARRIEIPFDIECIGHFHQTMEIPIGGSSKTLVNGSWVSKGDYGWRKFGSVSRAEQTYFGVSPKRPRTWNYTIDLLHSKDEWKNLKRRE